MGKYENELSIKLRALREANGFTQSFVAEQLNLTRPAYSCYELGTTEPSLATLNSLSKLFAVPVEYFLTQSNKSVVFYDSKNDKDLKVEQPKTMGELSKDEREIIGLYRMVSPCLQRKIYNKLSQEPKENKK